MKKYVDMAGLSTLRTLSKRALRRMLGGMKRLAYASLLAASPLFLLFSCGSRTGLFDDATATRLAPDATVLPDGRVIPTIDSAAADAPPFCGDASTTLVYVVTNADEVLRFDPGAATFTPIGTLACPDPQHPFSMAVDHRGIAYVLYSGGGSGSALYRVSLSTARCEATSFLPRTDGFASFGMGFAADDSDAGESLYVASDDTAGGGELGRIDVGNFRLTDVGRFSPSVNRAELTGTGDGRLFAFYAKANGTSSAIAQIDKASGLVIAEDELPGIDQGTAWAFAFWGGDFYLFTAPQASSSIVTRFRPSDGSLTQIATYPDHIVGAGVSTCAPQK